MKNTFHRGRGVFSVAAGSLVVFSLVTFSMPALGSAKNCPPVGLAAAEAFVRGLHDGAKEVLLKSRNPVSDLAVFISKNVEIERVAQYAMGPAWNSATPEQRAQYVKLFRLTTLRTLASHITLYDGAAYKVLQSRAIGEDKDEFLVMSTITPKSGKSFGVGWRVTARDCKLKASDIVNGGVSLVVTKRQEFASVIAREGIDGLLQRLRVLAANQRKGSAEGSEKGEEVLVDLVLRAAEKLGNSRF